MLTLAWSGVLGITLRAAKRELLRTPLYHSESSPGLATANARLLIRDRALLLIGFRRSDLEVVAIEAIEVVRRSKTDVAGADRPVFAFGSNPKTCPVRAYRR
jgi:hypothetical protein